jgi:hypothetical protein
MLKLPLYSMTSFFFFIIIIIIIFFFNFGEVVDAVIIHKKT